MDYGFYVSITFYMMMYPGAVELNPCVNEEKVLEGLKNVMKHNI